MNDATGFSNSQMLRDTDGERKIGRFGRSRVTERVSSLRIESVGSVRSANLRRSCSVHPRSAREIAAPNKIFTFCFF